MKITEHRRLNPQDLGVPLSRQMTSNTCHFVDYCPCGSLRFPLWFSNKVLISSDYWICLRADGSLKQKTVASIDLLQGPRVGGIH